MKMKLNICWLSTDLPCCMHTLLTPALCPPGHPSPLQSCTLWVHLPVCTQILDWIHPSATPCTLPCWISLGSQGPTFQVCSGPFGWYPFHLSYYCLLTVISKLAESTLSNSDVCDVDGGENAMVSPLSHVRRCNELHRGLILNYNFPFSCKRTPSFLAVGLHAEICRVIVYHRPNRNNL